MDQLADMFVKIKNASRAGHETALVAYSQIKFDVAKILEASGFVAQVTRRGKKTRRFIELRFDAENAAPKIEGLERISRVSKRIYAGWRELKFYQRGRGTIIVSTPAGVLAHNDAIKQKVGGELLGRVW